MKENKEFNILFLILLLFLSTSFTTAVAQKQLSSKRLKKKYEKTNIYKEQNRTMLRAGKKYPDSVVLTPWHFLDAWVMLPHETPVFKSISIDIVIKDAIPDGFNYYISPITSAFNDMLFYCGIQTSSGGKSIVTGQNKNIGRGGIFSRWYERDTGALKTTGYYSSSDAEGDFISVRNKLKWTTGTYRLTLYKSGYVPGEKIPKDFSKKELMFSWGRYEHSWVTMKVKNLETGDSVIIGSLAFPGRVLQFPDKFAIFLEHYGATNIDFSHTNRNWDLVRNYKILAMNYQQVPHTKLAFKNIRINKKPVKPVSIHLQYNGMHNPNQKEIKMPIPRFATLKYDSTQKTIQCETGRLFGW